MDNNFISLLNKEGYIIYPIHGISMLPLLEENKDVVRLEKSDEYRLYDVVLFNRNNQYVLHRIYEIKGDKYHIIGDNSYQIDKVHHKDILAKMVGYYKDEQYISISDPIYQEYLSRYIINKDPLKKTLINPYENNKTYKVNDQIKSAYRSLFIYSVIPSNFDINVIKELSKEAFYNFYLLCIYKKSDHILSDIVNKYKLDIDKTILDRLNKINNISKARSLYQDYYKSEISNLFKEHHIPHIYFRGVELKDKFTNPHLRVSNDIDIYVDKKDLDKARELIINKYHPYEFDTHTVHKTFNLPQGKVQIELHYELLEGYLDRINKIIGDPFKHGSKDKDNEYLYHFDNEYYYLYHLAHFAKHIKEGEFWISMLQDSYLLNEYSTNNELITKGELDRFNDTINEILDYYINNKEPSDKVIDLEKIVYKDAFNNYVLINKNKYKNKLTYIFRRLFLTPSELVTTYPSMKKHMWLYPFYLVKRLFKKKKNKPSKELKTYNELKREDLDIIYKKIGIYF